MKNKIRQELLQQIREEKEEYMRKQFSKNPYYVLLRFFGASWFWHIRELSGYEDSLNKRSKR